jgi:hypothetical protein
MTSILFLSIMSMLYKLIGDRDMQHGSTLLRFYPVLSHSGNNVLLC